MFLARERAFLSASLSYSHNVHHFSHLIWVLHLLQAADGLWSVTTDVIPL
jgi:hypothetical protein